MQPILRAALVGAALALGAPQAAESAPSDVRGPDTAPVIEAGGFKFKFRGHHGFRHHRFGGFRRHGLHRRHDFRGHFLFHPKRFPHAFHFPKRFHHRGFRHRGFRHNQLHGRHFDRPGFIILGPRRGGFVP